MNIDDREGGLPKLPPHLQRALLLSDLASTLAWAHTRCWTWDDIYPRIRTIWKDSQAEQIISRLAELSLADEQLALLTIELDSLSVACETVPTVDRARADRRYMRLVRMLPPQQALDRVVNDLLHRRKLRRDGAMRLLKKIGVDAKTAKVLQAAYAATQEQGLLHLIARSRAAVESIDPIWLLNEIDDPYWQMRVLEALLLNGDGRALDLRHLFPRAFLNAIGRVGAVDLAPLARELATKHVADYRLLDLAAWTFGKLCDQAGLDIVRLALEEELERDPIDQYFPTPKEPGPRTDG